MKAIRIYNPKKLAFGPGVINEMVDDYLASGMKRIYILSIPVIIEKISGQIRRLEEAGIEIRINTSLTAEPSLTDFYRLKEETETFKADSVAGIGGGSIMDLAKVLAAFSGTGLDIEAYFGINLLSQRNIHLACVPTTSGTGSEVSPNSIILEESSGAKKGIISPYLLPDASYVDPELTLGLPAGITAFTGIDALTHCIEAYTNKFAHPIIDDYALKGIELISQNLVRACREPGNLEARTALSLGSMYGGICLGPVNTAAVHALAYPLGSDYKVPHGLSNAVLLPHVMEFNLESPVKEKYNTIARVMGGTGNGKVYAEGAVEAVGKLLVNCSVPLRMRELGVEEERLEEMAEAAILIERLLKNNPRDISVDDILGIYRIAY